MRLFTKSGAVTSVSAFGLAVVPTASNKLLFSFDPGNSLFLANPMSQHVQLSTRSAPSMIIGKLADGSGHVKTSTLSIEVSRTASMSFMVLNSPFDHIWVSLKTHNALGSLRYEIREDGSLLLSVKEIA